MRSLLRSTRYGSDWLLPTQCSGRLLDARGSIDAGSLPDDVGNGRPRFWQPFHPTRHGPELQGENACIQHRLKDRLAGLSQQSSLITRRTDGRNQG